MDANIAISLTSYYFGIYERAVKITKHFETIFKNVIHSTITDNAISASMAFANISVLANKTAYMSHSFNICVSNSDLERYNMYHTELMEAKIAAKITEKTVLNALSAMDLTDEVQMATEALVALALENDYEDLKMTCIIAENCLQKLHTIASIAIVNNICKGTWLEIHRMIELISLELTRVIFANNQISISSELSHMTLTPKLIRLSELLTRASIELEDDAIVSYYETVGAEAIRAKLMTVPSVSYEAINTLQSVILGCRTFNAVKY